MLWIDVDVGENMCMHTGNLSVVTNNVTFLRVNPCRSLALRLKAMREAAKKRKKISNPSVAKLIGRPVVVGGLTGKVTSASTHYKQPRFTIR